MVWIYAKRVLEKHFVVNVDYKVALPRSGERKNEGGNAKRVLEKHFVLDVDYKVITPSIVGVIKEIGCSNLPQPCGQLKFNLKICYYI